MSAAVQDPNGALAALYRLPLEEFVAARDQLARQLRAAGDRDGARPVAGLRRPSISAWAANQLAHAAPNAMAELPDAGAALQQAYLRPLTSSASIGKASPAAPCHSSSAAWTSATNPARAAGPAAPIGPASGDPAP
jgi:hypothetical protein